MKKIFAFLIIPFLVEASTQKAEDVLQASAKAYHQVKSAKIEFSQAATSELTGETQEVRGVLWVGQKDAFKLELKGFQLLSDGVNLYEYREQSQQVLIKSLLDLDRAFHPSQVLFKYLTCEPLSMDEAQLDGKILWHLKLNPQGKIKGVQTLEVWLDPSTLYPVQIKTTDVVSNENLYKILKFENLKTPPTDLFEWKQPQGAEVLDMR